jgi:ABC-2 type transport system permease protein
MIHLGKGISHYPVYLLLGIVIWSFFTEMTTRSTTSIVERGDLIRKISIPRWIIVLSSSISALINLILNLFVVAAFMIINHADPRDTILLLPLILLEVYALALGLSLLLSAAYVKYRDIVYIWEVILQAGFYLTPILYPLTVITNKTFQKAIMANPMAQAIQDARYTTVTHQSITVNSVIQTWWHQAIPYVIPVLVLILGIIYFRNQSKSFAENV